MKLPNLSLVFGNAITRLPVTKKNSILYYTYFFIEQSFIFLNKYLPLHRISTKPITKQQLTNKEHISKYNIPLDFFSQKKKLGITGVARLKNGGDFLRQSLESYLPFLDELILVDNNSTDNTIDICMEFQAKYPGKVKFYSYEPEVFHCSSGINSGNNSVHSLSYYYNWCFSKATYSHVIKIDDDNIAIQSQYKKLVKTVLSEDKAGFYATWGLNIFEKNDQIGVFGKYPYPGKYGDHGIYKITPQTYYVQNGAVENLAYPYKWISHEFAFIHLKFMKKNYGHTNIKDPSIMQKAIQEDLKSDFLPLSNFISGNLLDEVNQILKNILLNNDN